MDLQAITLMEAYLIENLRKHGVANEELLNINDEMIERWETFDTNFDFSILKKLAKKDRDGYVSIIRNGYTVKFLTLNGLINLVQLKLAKTKEVDFAVHDNGISKLVVNEKEREQVEQILSSNWQVTETDEGLSIRSIVA